MKGPVIRDLLDVYRLLGAQRVMFWTVLAAALVVALWSSVTFLLASTVIQGVIDVGELPWGGFRPDSVFARSSELLSPVVPERRVMLGFVFTVASMILGGVMGLANHALNVQFLKRFLVSLQTRCFETLLSYRLNFHDETRRGELSQLIAVEVRSCYNVMKEVTTISGHVFRLGVHAVFMLVISWQLTAVFLALGLVVWTIMTRLNRLTESWSNAALAGRNELMAATQDALYGVKQVKLLCGEGRVTASIKRFSGEAMRHFARVGVLVNAQATIMQLSGLVGVTAIIGISAYAPWSPPLGSVVLFLFVAVGSVAPASATVREFGIVNQSLPAVRSVMRFLRLEGTLREQEGWREPDRLLTDSLVFENVSLSYPDRPNILRSVVLEIRRGDRVGIVGESGSGKTSLVNLIPRLYDPSQGRILIDGIDLRELKLRFLRSRVGMLSQDGYVFNGTVRQNIMMGRPGAREEGLIVAAKLAHAHEFVTTLPQGYDTIVGDRGVKLSGGQRQRINIAQVFLKDPEVLILDEATSALDSESETLVQEAIDQLSRNRTVITIAHRLSTLRSVDWIIVLERGRIAEKGTWDELLRRGGTFARMWEIQAAVGPVQEEVR